MADRLTCDDVRDLLVGLLRALHPRATTTGAGTLPTKGAGERVFAYVHYHASFLPSEFEGLSSEQAVELINKCLPIT